MNFRRYISLFLIMDFVSANAQDELATAKTQPHHQLNKGTQLGTIQVMYTNITGHPTATVPGTIFEFEPGTSTTHFERVYGHPNGNWVIKALNNQGSDMIMSNDQVVLIEGDNAAWTIGELVGSIERKIGINKFSEIAFSNTTTGGSTANDRYIVKYDGHNFFTQAREMDSMSTIPGAFWGNVLESANMLDNGGVTFSADGIIGVSDDENDILFDVDTVLVREGIDIPLGQLGNEAWENFDADDYWTSNNGLNWLVQGDLFGDTNTDDVLVYNNQVVIQDGVVLANSSFLEPVDSSGLVGAYLAPGGYYYARGNNDVTETDWIYSNGAVVTNTGEPAYESGTELWSDAEYFDCFFMNVGNSYGEYIIGGVTDSDTTSNGLLVKNNQLVVVRESDPIDLDGNGLFDDDAFFDTFGNDDGVLFDDGQFIFVATMKNAKGTRIGQGMFSVETDADLIFRHNLDW
ncbi:MAG: hypothetical protein R3E90_03465 [Marinicella sp.]|nr:hypothetical protein [Xanthomonadales bacterium]